MPLLSNNFRRAKGASASRWSSTRSSNKVPNRILNKYNTVTFETNFDIRKPVTMGLAPLNQDTVSTAQTKTVSPFYRFVNSEGDWNDGVFWYYGNNYNELPSDSHDNQGEGRPMFSNHVVDGTKLWGGSHIVYRQWYPGSASYPDLVYDGLDVKSKTASINLAWLRDTLQLRQISQSINLTEQMMYNPLDVDLATGASIPTTQLQEQYYSPLPSTRSVFNLPSVGHNTLNRSVQLSEAYSSFPKFMSFCIRNIILVIPADVTLDQEDMEDTRLFETPQSTKSLHRHIYDIIAKDLFLKDDYVYGCPTKTQQDLYMKVNPRYKVLRDFKQYHVSPDPVNGQLQSNQVKTSFYHRYRTDIPTPLTQFECPTDVDYSNYTSANSNDHTLAHWDSTKSPSMIDTRGGPVAPQLYWKTAKGEYLRSADALGHQGEDAYLRNTLNVTCMPKTSRIIWLRFPRFAHNFELKDVLSDKFQVLGSVVNLTPGEAGEDNSLVSSQNLKHLLQSAYLKINGIARWKVLRPSAAGERGTIDPIMIRDGTDTADAYAGDGAGIAAADDADMGS